MNKTIILSLLQKNFRTLQQWAYLKSFLTESPWELETLLAHLSLHEPQFFRDVWSDQQKRGEEEREISRLYSEGVQFTFPGDALYPEAFAQISGAPFFLSFLGHPCWQQQKSIAVVGSRDATNLSRLWMEDCFATFLRQVQPVVVSGGARGIDQMAHQLALRNQCPTIILLPSGLGALYPSTLEKWKRSVIDGGGCLVSEYPFYQGMQKHFFQDRNRLIAALGAMTLLIEAKRRSGSLLTAMKTLEFGKSVFVVPGHPSDLSHLGNIDLLSEGATPIRDAEDLHRYFQSELSGWRGVGPRTSQFSLLQS